MAMDRRIQAEYPGEPLTEAEYRAAVEATLDPCPCGGHFRDGAPARRPGCRSTGGQWDRDAHWFARTEAVDRVRDRVGDLRGQERIPALIARGR